MKTNIEHAVIETSNHDVAANSEANGNKHGMSDWKRAIKQKCEAKARQYLAEHPKTKYYVASGYPAMMESEYFTPDPTFSSLIAYTDNEIKRIKELIVEGWNRDNPESQIRTIEGIDDLDLAEYQGNNAELDNLLWGRAALNDFVMTDLNMDHPVHAYHFSAWEYDLIKGVMSPGKSHHAVILTDDEYVCLLTEQLFNRRFSFNRLMQYDAPLAQKISRACDGDYMSESINPYLILMDEVLEDAERIDGNLPIARHLYGDTVDGIMKHVELAIEHNQISIFWETCPETDITLSKLESGEAEEIDAFAIQKIIGGRNFDEMAERIAERFNTSSAYEDLLDFLHENGIFEGNNIAVSTEKTYINGTIQELAP